LAQVVGLKKLDHPRHSWADAMFMGYAPGAQDEAAMLGRRRGGGRQSEFSLGWGADVPDNDARGHGKRIAGSVDKLSQSAYARALQEQIAARDVHRAVEGVPQRARRLREEPGGHCGSREPSPFAQLGCAVIDPRTKAAVHGQELRAQIEARAAVKEEARRQRASEMSEDGFRAQAEAAQQEVMGFHNMDSQMQRHQAIAARADALERFVSCQNGTPAQDHGQGNAIPAGFRAPPRQQRSLPPRPEQGFSFA